MTVVDTSAMMAMALDEPQAEINILISAGTLAELRIVAARRGIRLDLANFIERVYGS